MLVAMAVLATLLAAWYGQRYWQIAAGGATAPAAGVTVERQPVVGKNAFGDPYRYYASYRFTDAEGRVHSARQAIGRDLYDKLSGGNGTQLVVHYSRARPDVNVLDMDAARIVPLILAGLAAFLWIVALARVLRG